LSPEDLVCYFFLLLLLLVLNSQALFDVIFFYENVAYVREHFYIFDDAITLSVLFFFLLLLIFIDLLVGKHEPLAIVIVVFLFPLLRHVVKTREKAKNPRLFYRDGNKFSGFFFLSFFFIVLLNKTTANNQQDIGGKERSSSSSSSRDLLPGFFFSLSLSFHNCNNGRASNSRISVHILHYGLDHCLGKQVSHSICSINFEENDIRSSH
jgi:hypothetical protein